MSGRRDDGGWTGEGSLRARRGRGGGVGRNRDGETETEEGGEEEEEGQREKEEAERRRPGSGGREGGTEGQRGGGEEGAVRRIENSGWRTRTCMCWSSPSTAFPSLSSLICMFPRCRMADKVANMLPCSPSNCD
jgi:hypothetical protein